MNLQHVLTVETRSETFLIGPFDDLESARDAFDRLKRGRKGPLITNHDIKYLNGPHCIFQELIPG